MKVRNHSVNARMVPRTQDWMTRLRLMRACRSISKDNGGTELSFSDIVSSYVARRAESARRTVGRGLKAHRGSTGVPNRRRDVRLEAHLQPVLNVFEISWRSPLNGKCNRSDSCQLFDKTSLGAALSFRVPDFSVRRVQERSAKSRQPDHRAPPDRRRWLESAWRSWDWLG